MHAAPPLTLAQIAVNSAPFHVAQQDAEDDKQCLRVTSIFLAAVTFLIAVFLLLNHYHTRKRLENPSF